MLPSRKFGPAVTGGLRAHYRPGGLRCARASSPRAIVHTLKQVEAGRHVKDVCRERGISEATDCVWKSKYSGMEAADIGRLKALKEENSRLKRMYADLAPEVAALKDVIAKKAVGPAAKRPLVAALCEEHVFSERRACVAVGLSRSVARYVPPPDQDEVIAVLRELAERFPEHGLSKLFKLIRRRGHGWNHKRVWRVYSALGLNQRRIGKKRLPRRNPLPLAVGEAINAGRSADFMSDA